MMATATAQVTNNEPPKENKGSSSSLDDISKVSSSSRRPSARRQRGGMSNSLSNSLNHRGSGLASTMGSLTTSFSEDIGKGLSKVRLIRRLEIEGWGGIFICVKLLAEVSILTLTSVSICD